MGSDTVIVLEVPAPTVVESTRGPVGLRGLTGAVGPQGIQGDVRVGGVGVLPVASVTYRGVLWLVQGAAGVTDRVYVCLKAAADTYSWVSLASGG